MNFGMIVYILAWVLKIEALSLLLPLLISLIYREQSAVPILLVALLSGIFGTILGFKKPRRTAFYE